MHKHKKQVLKPKEIVNKKFKFVYIDPASMTHDWFLYEMPGDKDTFEVFNASGLGRFINKETVKLENIVPLK